MIDLLRGPAVSKCCACGKEPVLPIEDCRCCAECEHEIIRLVVKLT